ncbi:MAG: putative tRNA-dihydrouridine synthase [candidate division WS2 bacterium]|nr:putative tRNA-dihydrouridine synthase [Candidatus Lithacetigena glycinireducens]
MSFWNELPKPFFVMAPMADVTDVAFRALVAARGTPDVFWTEFVSADGLYHTREIKKMSDAENPLMRDLAIGEGQRPIVAQIFSSKPEMIAYATKLAGELGFDGIDINMGCPDRAIEWQGCGAAMIKNPKLAVEIIRAAQRASTLPVSVKTRVGYNKESLDEWLTVLLEASPAAITLHLRTRKEMSLVPADWGLMKKAVEIRNRVNPEVLLIGNGDVRDIDDATIKIAESGCDGAMLGRAMFGNPWVFSRSENESGESRSLEEKLAALVELAHGFEKITPVKNFAILKKHIKAFVTGFDGAAELRARLMEAESADELASAIRLHERAPGR